MNIEGKRILILGYGITGISAAKTLLDMGAEVYVYDKNYDSIVSDNTEAACIKVNTINTIDEISEIMPDICIKSPGIHPENEFVLAAREYADEVISDLELVYRLFGDRKIIAITGTNGKTTTTTLVGEIINSSKHKAHIAGNIGIGMLPVFEENSPDDYYIIECSSFQLEDTAMFRAYISGILNVTPDHLDWHGSYEAYKNAKLKIFQNSLPSDHIVLNYDDEFLSNIKILSDANVLFFSKEKTLDRGLYVEDGTIIYDIGTKSHIMDVDEIPLLGKHNLENVLMAIGICINADIDYSTIRNAVKSFKGVEHRIEFVREVQGVKYYNDSKGTNVDATINAIKAFDSGVILIAGGYDKKIEFDELIKNFGSKVESLILFGETAEQIRVCSEKYGFKSTYMVDDMEDAVAKAYELSKPGYSVLLSPACASWGMYKNFEQRGNDFKNIVNGL